MTFKIEQIAIAPPDPAAAKELLTAMGAGPWSEDHVVARGPVHTVEATNEADLSFEYSMLTDAHELEVLHYTSGRNWVGDVKAFPRVSHFGVHCTPDELAQWRPFFSARGIPVVQEVKTQSHTNPHIRDSRRYHYVIFGTAPILGVDIKFIVRRSVSS